MNQPITQSEFVRFATLNGVLIVTLDRPKALNALDLGMVRAMGEMLLAAAQDSTIKAVIIEGSGGRAFCSGGDVRAVAVANAAGDRQFGKDFFWHEYRLNELISRYPKPFIALCDGITMGGGIGVSVHGSVRIVSERLSLAMPETAIGLFPDVGSGWFLSRAPGKTGLYLALSGERFGAGDALYLGFAHTVVPSEAFPQLKADLIAAAPVTREAALTIAKNHATTDYPAPTLPARQASIDHCFAGETLAEIVRRLTEESPKDAAAAACLDMLHHRCPTSMGLTHEFLKRIKGLPVQDVLQIDYLLALRCIATADFAEGIRAVLIDKDNQPRWNPATIEGLSDQTIEGFFAPLPAGERGLVWFD